MLSHLKLILFKNTILIQIHRNILTIPTNTLFFYTILFVPTYSLLNILNYYSNNAIINQTTLYTGKVFAIQLEDVTLSNDCFKGTSFSVNLGSVDIEAIENTTIDRGSIGSNSTENNTATVKLVPVRSNNCSNTGSSVYRLAFYTFLKNTLFQSPEQEKNGFKLGSIILSVGGSAVLLAEKLIFTFRVIKVNYQMLCGLMKILRIYFVG